MNPQLSRVQPKHPASLAWRHELTTRMNVTPCSYWPNESHAIPYPSTLDLKHSPILVLATQGYFWEALKKNELAINRWCTLLAGREKESNWSCWIGKGWTGFSCGFVEIDRFHKLDEGHALNPVFLPIWDKRNKKGNMPLRLDTRCQQVRSSKLNKIIMQLKP